jgi:glycosyltransferase involved in cell wall biosynthesis
MTRPLAFDLSHLSHRLRYRAPSGIEKVDMAYARYFCLQEGRICDGVQYGLTRPRLMSPSRAKTLVGAVASKWASDIAIGEDATFRQIRRWLIDPGYAASNLAHRELPARDIVARSISGLQRSVAPAFWRDDRQLPKGAIYLNVAQHALEKPLYFSWLTKRPDLKPVFFVHDLLPLRRPEFWPPGHLKAFQRRIACVARHAAAIVTTSNAVGAELREEMDRLGRSDIRILALPFPSPLALAGKASRPDHDLVGANYFVAVNTIEPRKNLSLLLDVWEELAKAATRPPRLVLIGKRGWRHEAVTDRIEQDAALRSLVIEAAGLSDSGLQALLASAKALLAPSFAEGHGLPIVEALTLGTPVLASDIPVFREASQGRASFRDSRDVMGWRDAVIALSQDLSPLSRVSRAAAGAYAPMTGEAYFTAVEAFLATL